MASVPEASDRLARPPKSLSDLPIEVFQQVAVQTVISSSPPAAAAAGPPSAIRNLLLTSKQINNRLSFDYNPSFYGEIFDAQFDTAALKRRFHKSRLTAPCRAAELKRRWICLKRIKQYSRGRQPVWGYPGFPGIYSEKDKLQDAWLAFLMLTENDGLNMIQLSWASVVEWTRSFIQHDIYAISANAQRSGQLPVVSEIRALGMWLYWMTTKFDDVVNEPVGVLSKVNRMLRPFTFASWAYPSFFAPWQLSHVPPPNTYTPPALPAPPAPATSTSTPTPVARPPGPPIPRNSRRPQPPPVPQPPAVAQPATPTFFRPNFLPPTIVLPSYLGHPLPLTPPLINHSASLLFFSRMQRFRLGEDSARPEDLEILKQFRDERGPDASFTPRYARTQYVWGESSDAWDEDVRRLGEVCRTLKTRAIWKGGQQQQAVQGSSSNNALTVADRMAVDEKKEGGPSGSGLGRRLAPGRPPAAAAASFAGPLPEEDDVKGMKRYRYVPGTFAGEWGGRFVIYGLDAHQNVAQGVPGLQALESTVLTQDPQGWRLREYHHPSILKGKHRAAYEAQYQASSSSSSTSSSHKPIYKSPSHLRPPVRPAGQPLSAFIPRGLSVTKLRNGGLEVFNHLEGARSGAASEGVFYYEVPARKGDGGEEDDDEGVWDETEPKEDDLNGSDDVDVIIEGESIQPMFVPPGRQTMMEPGSKVIGTIRRWDGLITLLATPLHANPPPTASSNPEQQRTPARTQWLYRGYMTANGNWVGRWRDTWNDVTVEGYEGVFVLSKRPSGTEESSSSTPSE
ncbi:hypothetical protein FRC04_008783 [Tulasnella sp. 424]|nr:hypothetical protein FRC04_008783 [Tulasnella sp. 424]KAG8980012.1 hypothetical protein FRC05_007455 [Tulasnella sp. 425]